jgi:signal recognition particle receptor subunit beta
MSEHLAAPARASIGDVLVVAGHHVGEAQQKAEILEILGEPGHERFRVRWEDGRETTIYPGSDAVVRRAGRKEKP